MPRAGSCIVAGLPCDRTESLPHWNTSSFATHRPNANAHPSPRIRTSTTNTSMLLGYVTLHPLSYFYFDPVDKSRTLSLVPSLPASEGGVMFAAYVDAPSNIRTWA
ncbi:hypothetical protein K443DRAFT_675688 [Laccaria amethystina LaAM-08-1]|uniref:Uncharacterized protein n=1 Tax=Laccaria amethystina LaAM-08-1 TaxID=1095629 RepID=A0A0C9Y3K8_9AGAR|nr:hypothetical protein K443DRAFT_675688 [Laccaria amethystina LaAM-08-1]